MTKRNKYYRSGDIDLENVDKEIKDLKDDIVKRKNQSLQQVDKLPLIKTKECPDLLFDPPSETGSTALVTGSSKRGKTMLLVKIYDKYFKDVKDMIVILISPSCNNPLFKKLPKDVIRINRFDSQTDRLLKQLFKLQNLSNNAYKFALLIDDCVSNRYTESLNFLFLVARNLMFSCIACVQRETLVSKDSRSSANNVISFGINTESSIKSLLENFFKGELKELTGLKTMDSLISEFRRLTSEGGGHSFLVYIPFERSLKHYVLEK
jgi:hypothetical protein